MVYNDTGISKHTWEQQGPIRLWYEVKMLSNQTCLQNARTITVYFTSKHLLVYHSMKSQTANCNAYLKVDNEHNYCQFFPADFNISHSRSIFCHKVMHP